MAHLVQHFIQHIFIWYSFDLTIAIVKVPHCSINCQAFNLILVREYNLILHSRRYFVSLFNVLLPSFSWRKPLISTSSTSSASAVRGSFNYSPPRKIPPSASLIRKCGYIHGIRTRTYFVTRPGRKLRGRGEKLTANTRASTHTNT